MKRICSLVSVLLILGLIFTHAVWGAAENRLGDPNGDGDVSAQDALYVLKVVVGKESPSLKQESACDIDCSDDVSAADALQMLRVVVGKELVRSGMTDRTFTIGSVYAYKYAQDTAYGKAWKQAVETAEKTYGIAITVELLNLNEDLNNLWIYDMIELPVHSARSLAKSNKLMDLSHNAVLQHTVTQSGSALSCQMGDTLFGVASHAMSANPMGLAINKDLLAQYAPDAYAKLQQQFEQKTWTWEALNQLISEYRKNRPNSAVMASNTNIIGQAIVANAGYEVTFLADGSRAVSSIATDEGIAALSYVKQLHDSGAFAYEADMNKVFDSFEQGKVPMVVYYLNEVAAAATERDFSMTAMPFPIGPQQSDYVMCTFNSSVFAVPAFATVYGNAHGLIFNALATADNAIAQGLVASAASLGYDTLGASVYDWAAKNTSEDFSTGPFTGAVGGPVDGSVLDPAMDPKVEIPKIKDLIQSEVDAYYGKFYKN